MIRLIDVNMVMMLSGVGVIDYLLLRLVLLLKLALSSKLVFFLIFFFYL